MEVGILSFNVITLIYYLLDSKYLFTVKSIMIKGRGIAMKRYEEDKSFIIDTGNGSYTTKWLTERFTDATTL